MALAVLIFSEGYGIGFASIDTAKIWGEGKYPPVTLVPPALYGHIGPRAFLRHQKLKRSKRKSPMAVMVFFMEYGHPMSAGF